MIFWLFFVKQKTAYEMRISDWSSDVCSSDLQKVGVAGRTLDQHDARRARRRIGHPARARNLTVGAGQAGADHAVDRDRIGQREFITRLQEAGIAFFLRVIVARRVEPRRVGRDAVQRPELPLDRFRSEEHTSELTSLIS